jgi:1,4-alpha-glucan branching enzyme
MFTQPGKKLLFMGDEFGQWREWNHETSLDWHLLQYDRHQALQKLVGDLAHLYRSEPALHELDFEWKGFDWIDCNDSLGSVLSYLRRGKSSDDIILVGCNFTPIPRNQYRIGVPRGGYWQEILNSDADSYWGSGLGNKGGLQAENTPYHGQPFSLNITLPPLAAVIFKSPST